MLKYYRGNRPVGATELGWGICLSFTSGGTSLMHKNWINNDSQHNSTVSFSKVAEGCRNQALPYKTCNTLVSDCLWLCCFFPAKREFFPCYSGFWKVRLRKMLWRFYFPGSCLEKALITTRLHRSAWKSDWVCFHLVSSLGFHFQHMLRLGVIFWSAGDLLELRWSATLLSSLFTACFGGPSVHLARYAFMRLRCLVAGV